MQTRSHQQQNDEELALSAMRGDLRAYSALAARYRGAVIVIAEEATGSRVCAEDVAQEVFIIVFQSLPRLREPSRFASWLYAITRYRARRAFKRSQRLVTLDLDSLSALADSAESQPEKALLKKESESEIRSAAESLKSEWRVVFLLRYQEEWSIAQIAGFLALPLTTVNWRLYQARKRLMQQLSTENNNKEI